MATTYFFIDESKAKGYVLVAVAVPAGAIPIATRVLRSLVLPGQRSIHMHNERDSRRRAVLDAIAVLADHGVSATVFDASGGVGTQLARHQRCLDGVVSLAAMGDEAQLVLDLDETLRQWDRQRLANAVYRSHARGHVTYRHQAFGAELLLSLPDAVAWSWMRGGEWRRRIALLVGEVRPV
jgi:hypothetical protein